MVAPTATLPKLALVGTAETDGCAPEPVIQSPNRLCAALLEKMTIPYCAPTTVGANLITKVKLWPTDNVTGSLNPLMVIDAEALNFSLLKMMGALPAFFMVTDMEVLVSTLTLPNWTAFGVTRSCPPACGA